MTCLCVRLKNSMTCEVLLFLSSFTSSTSHGIPPHRSALGQIEQAVQGSAGKVFGLVQVNFRSWKASLQDRPVRIEPNNCETCWNHVISWGLKGMQQAGEQLCVCVKTAMILRNPQNTWLDYVKKHAVNLTLSICPGHMLQTNNISKKNSMTTKWLSIDLAALLQNLWHGSTWINPHVTPSGPQMTGSEFWVTRHLYTLHVIRR